VTFADVIARGLYSVYHRKICSIRIENGVAKRGFTTEEVVAYLGRNDSSNEKEELAEESFTGFIGVVASDSDSVGVSGDRREGC